MLMAYQWHLNGLFLYFSYFFHIFHSPSLSSCTSTATVTASAASAPWCPKTEKETHCNAYAMGGNQRKENGIKLPSNLKAMDWLCLCNPINLYQPAVSSNSRNWSMSSRNSTSITSVHSVYSDYSLRQGAAKSKRRGFKGSWRSVEDFRRSQRSTTEKPLCWLY